MNRKGAIVANKKKSSKKISKKNTARRTARCSKCKQQGHNVRTCKRR